MFENECMQMRILSNWADAQGMGSVRDLLRKAEYEVRERAKRYQEQFCTTDVGDGSTIYDSRPRG